jgi:hypothetical protein
MPGGIFYARKTNILIPLQRKKEENDKFALQIRRIKRAFLGL